ncbi:DUF6894 family protein [Pseudorhizobium pelagicum]
MPTYRLHIRDQNELVADLEGVELPNLDEAIEEAVADCVSGSGSLVHGVDHSTCGGARIAWSAPIGRSSDLSSRLCPGSDRHVVWPGNKTICQLGDVQALVLDRAHHSWL